MSKEREFLYGITDIDDSVRCDEVEIKSMSSLEIAVVLHEGGMNAAHLVDKVHTTTNAMRMNAMIARRMKIEKADVRRRAIILAVLAFIGLGAILIAIVGAAIAPDNMSEAARKLLVLIFVGGIGLFLISLLATLYVLWNAFIHKAILAEVASEETDDLVATIEQVRAREPTATITQLVVMLEQNPIWAKHNGAQTT